MDVKLKETEPQITDKSVALQERTDKISKGGAPKYHQKLQEEGKLFARERLRLLLDPGFEIEDAKFANCMEADLPADGVVTGVGQIEGRTVCFMANDATVKAGSWGWRTVRKNHSYTRDCDKAASSADLSRRFSRCAYNRPDRDVPRAQRRWKNIPQPSSTLRLYPADLFALRTISQLGARTFQRSAT